MGHSRNLQLTLIHLLKLEAPVLHTELVDTETFDDKCLIALAPALIRVRSVS